MRIDVNFDKIGQSNRLKVFCTSVERKRDLSESEAGDTQFYEVNEGWCISDTLRLLGTIKGVTVPDSHCSQCFYFHTIPVICLQLAAEHLLLYLFHCNQLTFSACQHPSGKYEQHIHQNDQKVVKKLHCNQYCFIVSDGV